MELTLLWFSFIVVTLWCFAYFKIEALYTIFLKASKLNEKIEYNMYDHMVYLLMNKNLHFPFPILLIVPKSLLQEADPSFFQATTIPQVTTKAGKDMPLNNLWIRIMGSSLIPPTFYSQGNFQM